ncbi:uncharacterized protein L969DRAFT_94387 [Mixia osmundae IAM 14324]|uniref:ornithine carbamoyltransferase n=1 Tax=Mixia osmundae (strain CBS 9802 / IAM 14324 / JCM 22182 / KY 12970) TaxID=764103 RepID=G7E3B8_MIXOS|nr:uncharacterized protein L969DRAFT_94387 [Mixia osmundae IAM 14324]KEI39315.1 hypothetical protein L969DRAFT_94387 [Mixia osmundae IAM 14324]GAA97328.1 hypothetical protein E5Q_04006 [Mixia osmundae IAM 14324]
MKMRTLTALRAVQCRTFATSSRTSTQHLMSTADLSVPQMQQLLTSAADYKSARAKAARSVGPQSQELSLANKTIAMLFSKRSTRTRVASESSIASLGGHPMFLGSSDIQLGVNESLLDSAKVISSMTDGIIARVNDHSEVETLAKYSSVPVINALSHLYHPTQILAHLLALLETYSPKDTSLSKLKGLKVAWVGDSNNILNDMIVSFQRIGIDLNIATPEGYPLDQFVLDTATEGLRKESGDGKLLHTHSPEEAVKDADVLVTDTWISMGQEAEKAKRLKDFAGFQITMDLAKRGGAKPDWTFTHCLPRKQEEVDDEVFYSDRSLVFLEAENRRHTITAVCDQYFAKGGF